MSKTITERLIIPKMREGITTLDVETTRFAFFKSLFSKSGKMAKINLLAILFALPAIAWFLYSTLFRKLFNTTINYSGNLGLGYAMVEDAEVAGNTAKFLATLQHYAIMIPLIILAFIGLGGAFYAMRKMAQNDERVTKNFLHGIKVNMADFILHGMLASVIVFIFAVNLAIYDAFQIHLAIKIIGIILSIILLIVTLSYLLYATTLSTAYKAGVITIVKDSVLIAVKVPVHTIIMSLVGAIPFLVLYNALPGIFFNSDQFLSMLTTTVGVALFFFLGISLFVAAWTVYADNIFSIAFNAPKYVEKKATTNTAKVATRK